MLQFFNHKRTESQPHTHTHKNRLRQANIKLIILSKINRKRSFHTHLPPNFGFSSLCLNCVLKNLNHRQMDCGRGMSPRCLLPPSLLFSAFLVEKSENCYFFLLRLLVCGCTETMDVVLRNSWCTTHV